MRAVGLGPGGLLGALVAGGPSRSSLLIAGRVLSGGFDVVGGRVVYG
jgi:hypothetical protein